MTYIADNYGSTMTMPVFRYVSAPGNDWTEAVCLTARTGNPTVGTVVDVYGCDPNSASQPDQLWTELSENHTNGITPKPNWQTVSIANVGSADLTIRPTNWPVLTTGNATRSRDNALLVLAAPNRQSYISQTQLWNSSVAYSEATAGAGSGPAAPTPYNCGG